MQGVHITFGNNETFGPELQEYDYLSNIIDIGVHLYIKRYENLIEGYKISIELLTSSLDKLVYKLNVQN